MITKERETELCVLYEITSVKAGWLSKLLENLNINSEEQAFLEWLDGQEQSMAKRVKAWEKTMSFDERYGHLGETDDQKIATLTDWIDDIEQQHEAWRKMEVPYFERALMLLARSYDEKIKLRRKFRARMIHLTYPDYIHVTERDIQIAREVPLFKVWEDPIARGMVHCPFHDDKTPSMSIARGFGWCFTCQSWCDAIKYLCEVKKIPFIDAIKHLVRL